MIIDKNVIIEINKSLTGKNHQIINEAGIESALGTYMWYTNDNEAVCALFRSLCINHPFRDGNKRTALLTLLMCKKPIKCSDADLINITLDCASGKCTDVQQLTNRFFKSDGNNIKPYSTNTVRE